MAFLLCLTLVCTGSLTVFAGQAYTNPDTGYIAFISDDAELLTQEERDSLLALMEGITVYGNVGFKTISENPISTSSYIDDYYYQQFGYDSGTIFLIDMDNRNIWIHSNGAIYKVITDSYADTITDNVYTYASDADYYECAYKAFSQILTLLQGNKIAQPMKYISNAFLALILALLINFIIVKSFSAKKKPSKAQLMDGIYTQFRMYNPTTTFVNQTKTYSPQSSGGGGSHGGGGGGSHGGGGGGHSF